MRLHHLRLKGIGPFRDEVSLDLAALGASGLFLLEGPTGSGKSTILDAIVYALYGSIAGADMKRGNERIRSQFAPPTEPSVVDLIFETGSGIYRVRREPEYQRAKRRGSGTTRENAKGVLWRLGSPDLIEQVIAGGAGAGAGLTPISSRLDEIGAEITRAIGLTRQQFTQTVLLPQGEFARFLTADTAERQAVLTRVFGTEIYEDVEARLVDMRKDAKRSVTEAAGVLTASVARFAEAAALDDDAREALEAHAGALELEQIAETADAALAAAQSARDTTQTAATAATEDEVQRRGARDAAREALARIRRRRELDALAARLADEAPAHDEGARRLLRDRAAAPVITAAERSGRAETAAARAREELDRAVEATRTEDPDLAETAGAQGAIAGEGAVEAPTSSDAARRAGGEAEAPGDGSAAARPLAALAEAETGRAGELTALVALEAELPAREKDLAARREEQSALEARTAADAEALAARPAEREQLIARQREAQADAEHRAAAAVAVQTAQERFAAAKDAARQEAAVETAQTRAEDALRAAARAQETEADLRRRRTEGLAAELALDLADGEACPVCGALEHPRPAAPDAHHVSAETVAEAEETRRAADAAAAAARTALEVAQARRHAAAEAAGGLSVEDAEAALKDARTALAHAESCARDAEKLGTAVEEHDRRTAALQEAQQRRALAAREQATAIAAAAEALARDAERIRAARGEHASVAARRDHHSRRARAAVALQGLVDAAVQAAASAAEAGTELDAALETAAVALGDEDLEPFADAAEARAAALAPAERTGIAEAAQRRAVDASRLTDGMAEPGIADADPSDEAEAAARTAVEDAETALTVAAETARLAQAEAGRRAATAARTATAREALARASDAVVSVQATAGVILRVADLATGGSADGERVRLSTYVLMRRFEDVVSAANARLSLLSGADLELVRATTGRGAQRTGLDLRVIDRRTDLPRDPATLSGGETFFVSLALALGLADIVTAEAGGVQMQTLFIDEGFGSLDPERLDAVIGEIGRLSETGRVVGIVSHVGELKARIPEQIHVRRLTDRTSAVAVTA